MNCLFLEAFENGPNTYIPHCEKGHRKELGVSLVEGWRVTRANF